MEDFLLSQIKEISLTEKRKKQIIEATYRCILEQGYNVCTMQDIADKTGLSKGILQCKKGMALKK